ncbi:hypothetical protein SAMN06265379_10379 [Saccharicrinis carchari]|uniref:SSD domain-containing protein n=1 Tax=Saccharicrinis carchari TaxID=1168039 RepID=A0A521CF44_SACCC|nr:MMPL family transporter [Saccharicrinis carchari]SMO58053.1 hypothetical protein SAMN06265379_10379 [Saccharicrinis carchari]
MWIFIARTILKNRILFLSILFIITAFFAYKGTGVEMSYQYAPLLPEDDPTYLEYEAFEKVFSNEGNLMVIGVKDKNFFQLEHFKYWNQLRADVNSIEGVSSVFSVSESFDLVKNTELKQFDLKPLFNEEINAQHELDSIKNRFYELPFYKGNIYNKNKDAYLMAITLEPEILQSPERVALINEIVKAGENYTRNTKIDLHYSGLPYIRVTTAEMIKKELNMFIFLALGITAVIMFLFFRSFKVVMFSMLVVGMAVIWVVGTQALLGFKITILTGMIPPLIIVIGIPNSVFLLNKYHQEFKQHGNKIKALQRVICKIGNATFLTNLTTASGFATFIFTSSRILVEFGIIAAINIIGVFILSILLIPIIFSFLSVPQDRHLNHLNNKTVNKMVDKLVHITLNHRRSVYITTGLVLILGAIGIANIKTTGYMLDDIPHHDPLYLDLVFFEDNFDGLMPLEIMIDSKKANTALRTSNLKKLDQLHQKLSAHPDISGAIALSEVVKFARQAFYNGNPKYYSIPSKQERNFLLSYVSKGSGQQSSVINSFLDSLKQKTRMSFRIKDIGTTKMTDLNTTVQENINEIFPEDKYQTTVTGASVLFFKGTKYLIRNLFTSLFLAILLIASFMAWMFSSKRMVLVSLIPNVIPLISTAALMGYFGIPIKPSTILVFSIAFGISVDDTIHYLAKYRQELSETNWSIKAATVLALKETGVSMIYTSIILFFGFGIFGFSSFGGTVALGILVAVTLLIALLSNLILLPSLLLSLEKIITNKSFKEPLLQIYNEDEDIEIADLRIKNSETKRISPNSQTEE